MSGEATLEESVPAGVKTGMLFLIVFREIYKIGD